MADVVLVTGEYLDDHPQSPAGVIKRVLEANGHSVAVIEKPLHREDFTAHGRPKLCFCVTSGSFDSMVNNYTPLKKKRAQDAHQKANVVPDRAVIFYCNKLREYFKGCTLVIGGVEASLRRFAHYDYWDNALRKSIILDSRADILVYGNGEKQLIDIMKRLRSGEGLAGIEGTCVVSKEVPKDFMMLPSWGEVADKEQFCKMTVSLATTNNRKNLAQQYGNRFVLQYKYPTYTAEDLDWIYSLPFTRTLHPQSLLSMARFSVVTHRGCFGNCNFCSIRFHQGNAIISRSEKNILDEIKGITKHPDFKGVIDDLGGPSANMYGMDCRKCARAACMTCPSLDSTHSRLLSLSQDARKIPGVKKVHVKSGVRFDLALKSRKYIEDLARHHVCGRLKIAPEHVSPTVLELMNKATASRSSFDSFKGVFEKAAKHEAALAYYFMICHPGETKETLASLKAALKHLDNIEQFQLFTPTPMTISTCMYWTGMDPFTRKAIPIVYDYATKKLMKRELLRLIKSRN